MKKTKVLLIAVSVSIIIMFILLALIINKTNLLTNNGLINLNPESEQELFSYAIYDNQDSNNIKVLVTINSSNGIDYIEDWNENKISGNGKNKIALDYILKNGDEKEIRIKEIGKQNYTTEEIKINSETLEKTTLKIEKLYEAHGYKAIDIKKLSNINSFKVYYKIGNVSTWEEGESTIAILDYDIKEEGLMNEDNTVTVTAKLQDGNGNKIEISKNFEVDPNSTISYFEAESILDGVERFGNYSGIIKLKVNEVTYRLRSYYVRGDMIITSDTTLGKAEDVATASADAQSMILLKVDGDLTIDSGVTLTAYSSTYGGPKGMLVYCTGTLTNNGTITMTAKGARADGEEVYLWKNADSTYEYIPAVGGLGSYVPSSAESNGTTGGPGSLRGTGGGGSGAHKYKNGAAAIRRRKWNIIFRRTRLWRITKNW